MAFSLRPSCAPRCAPVRRQSRPSHRRFRPALELLESRTLLSGPGSLDPHFGTDGLVTTSFGGAGDFASAVLTQDNGKIVVVGTDNSANSTTSQIALARYNKDGSLDQSFGSEGKVLALFGPSDFAKSAVLGPDGKIIVTGGELVNPTTFQYQTLVAEFNPDGTLDTTFGNGGSVVLPGPSGVSVTPAAIALGPSGQIVILSDFFASFTNQISIAQLNPDGSLNPDFGKGGIVTTTFLPGTPTQHDPNGLYLQPTGQTVAVDGQGRVLVAGQSHEAGGSGIDATLVRFNPDGTFDKTFGHNGGITDVFGYTGYVASAIAFGPHDRIIVAGGAAGPAGPRSTPTDLALAELNDDGTPYLPFGFEGITLNGVPNVSLNFGTSLAVEPNGDLVVAGATFNPQTFANGLGMARYKPDGSLDLTFGENGIVTTFFPSPKAFFAGVAVVRGGDIVVAATTPDPETGNYDFGVAKYLGGRHEKDNPPSSDDEPQPPPSGGAGDLNPAFGTGGVVTSALGNIETGLATQTDGKIVAVGTDGRRIQLVRFNADGSPDQSFGSGGAVYTQIGAADIFESVAIQRDGKIDVAAVEYAGGQGPASILVVQYNPDGSLDQSFGSGGSVLTSLPDRQDFTVGGALIHVGLTIGRHGHIIVVGGASGGTGKGGLVIAEYDRQGNLDEGFGSGGLVITRSFSDSAGHTYSNPSGNAVAIDRRGRIVVAGTAAKNQNTVFPPVVALLARYNADGSLDQGFGFDGAVTSVFDGPPNNDYVPAGITANSVVIRPDGRIVVSGDAVPPPSGNTPSNSCYAVEQYKPDGSPDQDFGLHAIARYDVPFGFVATLHATSMVLQPDGDVLVAGTTNSAFFKPATHFAMIRLTPEGRFDPSFGSGGVVSQTFPNASPDSPMLVALEPNGDIVAGGTSGHVFGLAEYLGGSPGDQEMQTNGGGQSFQMNSVAADPTVTSMSSATGVSSIAAALTASSRQSALSSTPTALTPESVKRLDQLFAAGLEDGTSLVSPRSKRDLLSFSDEDGVDSDF
jgi:uncharacterized delta-60 repeat protein